MRKQTIRDVWMAEQGRYGHNIFINLDGEPVERTPWSHPYSFDEHVLWKSDDCTKMDHFVYSDRMMSWDWDKFHESVKQVWKTHGHYFDGDDPKDVEKFLSLYNGHPVKLTAILKGCNVSNGYPYFVFGYKEVANAE
ncbi:MAG: hypothetical protein IJZ68_09320 [Bacteroidaceae bacterium]|nr:hypothetical protein [Bacteroidaceae bacterium]